MLQSGSIFMLISSLIEIAQRRLVSGSNLGPPQVEATMREDLKQDELIDLGAASEVTLGDPGPDQEDLDFQTEEVA